MPSLPRGNYTMGRPKFLDGFECRAPLHYIKWDLVRRADEKRLEKVSEALLRTNEAFPPGKERPGSALLFQEARPALDRCHAGTPDIMTHRFQTLSLFKYTATLMLIFQCV